MFGHFITNKINLDKLQGNKNIPQFNRTKESKKKTFFI